MHSLSCARSGIRFLAASSCLSLLVPPAVRAQTAPPVEEIIVTTPRIDTTAPIADRFALPQTTASITGQSITETINALDTEDAVKYMPSLFVRKRNYGDTQPVLATRTWGINSSARSLVYGDDVLLTALVANNNTIGAPRWGMIAPDEIERVDVLYGPFAAEFPGNSMGAVMEITTRTPKDFEATATQVEAFQPFSLYGTSKTFRTDESQASAGGRQGDFTFRISGEHTSSMAQPLTFATFAGTPTGTTGIYQALNKLGQVANVAGATGILTTDMNNAKVKLSYDFSPDVRASYTFGLWTNDGTSAVQTYLRDSAGNPTYGGVSGFASGAYTIQELHTMHSLAVKSDSRGDWDGEAVLTHYSFDTDNQESPQGVTTGANFTTAGRLASYTGTNWSTLDAKAIWRPGGRAGLSDVGDNELSFGGHADQYVLNNPTTNIANWNAGSGSAQTGLYSKGAGQTETTAIWIQDAWVFAPGLTATLGGRQEWWTASHGYNFQLNGAVGVATTQPKVSADGFSPKATLAWIPAKDWTVKASFGEAWRFPTVGELYQLVSTGTTYTSPNPNLAPEHVRSGEIAVDRDWHGANVRVSLFQENVTNALIAQTSSLTQAGGNISYVSYTQNVGEIRNRGVEAAFTWQNAGINGFDLSGSATWVDSSTLADSNAHSSLNAALPVNVVGKRVPYVPDWRATMVASYRPDDKWTLTVAARYSGTMYSTIDNADRVSNVYQSFNSYLVADLRAHYAFTDWLSGSFGIDNIGNATYFEFHPFPQRTFVSDLKARF